MSPGQKVSLNLSIQRLEERIHASRITAWDKCPAPLAMVVFTSFIHNYSHHGIHRQKISFVSAVLWCSSTCVASSSSSVWKKLLIPCDCTEECQLRGMMGGGGESSIGPKAKPCGVPLITYILSTPPSYFIYAFHLFFKEALNRPGSILLNMPL